MTQEHHRFSAFAPVLFLLIATIASLPRFGQRENEYAPSLSDSDLYIEMAHVFLGDAPDFDRAHLEAYPHHYNRPLFPFLAGHLARYVLKDNLRAAFSIIDILGATLIGVLLLRLMLEYGSAETLAWMPSVLFLSGFPQLNWGYHILTDTLGLATAFGVAYYTSWLIRTTDAAPLNRRRQAVHLTLLFIASSLAFLARETAWLAVITTAWLIGTHQSRWKHDWRYFGLLLLVIIGGTIPHTVYSHLWHTSGVALRPTLAVLTDPRYVADFVVKTGVCFNLSWLLAAVAALRGGWASVPPFFQGWTIGGILYMGAGYAANSQQMIGYPLRLSYALFPLIFVLVARFFEQRVPVRTRTASAVGFCVLQYGINLLGVFLDPGRPQVRTTDVIKALKQFLLR